MKIAAACGDHGPENVPMLMPFALNPAKQEMGEKLTIKANRLKAAWNEEYLPVFLGDWTRLPCRMRIALQEAEEHLTSQQFVVNYRAHQLTRIIAFARKRG